jgi:hypothetical protein
MLPLLLLVLLLEFDKKTIDTRKGDRDVLRAAVVLHQDVGGAVDVQVGGHACRKRRTAAKASEAFMSGLT